MGETVPLEKRKKHSKKDKEYFSATAAVNHGEIIGKGDDSHLMDSNIDPGCGEVKELPQREKRKKKRKFGTMSGLGDDAGIVKRIEDEESVISNPKKVVSHHKKKNMKEKDGSHFPSADDAKVSDIGEQTSKKHRIIVNNQEIVKEENGEKIEDLEGGNDAKIRIRQEKLKKKKDILNGGELSSGSQEYVKSVDKVKKRKNEDQEIKNNHIKDGDTFATSKEPETKEFSNGIQKSFPTEGNDDEIKEKEKEKKKKEKTEKEKVKKKEEEEKKKKEKKKEKKEKKKENYILNNVELVSENGSSKSVMTVNERGKSKYDHKETKNHMKGMNALPSSDGSPTEESSKGKVISVEEVGSMSVLKGSKGKKKGKKREVSGIGLKNNLHEMTIKASKTKTLDNCEKAAAGEDISLDCYEGESNAEKRQQNEDDHSLHVEPGKKHKRVSFSSKVDVFPYDKNPSLGEFSEDLVRGKRFSQEEDEIIKQAVFGYIEVNNLGDNGVEKILNSKKYGLKGCWIEIAAALPWRPVLSVNHRAHIIFERSDKRHWEPYEYEMIQRHYDIHGGDWKSLAVQLGRCRKHLRETWRRINLSNKKTGNWTQDEYRALFELVNSDRQMRKDEKHDSQYGMLRDNISWEAISHVIGSRTGGDCCRKWYNQLTSPMVTEGIWDIDDDNRLLEGLLKLDAASLEEVDWDNVLDNRPGEVCRRRWSQMAKHIGEYQDMPFGEQVELLISRYCPGLLSYSDESGKGSEQKVAAP